MGKWYGSECQPHDERVLRSRREGAAVAKVLLKVCRPVASTLKQKSPLPSVKTSSGLSCDASPAAVRKACRATTARRSMAARAQCAAHTTTASAEKARI